MDRQYNETKKGPGFGTGIFLGMLLTALILIIGVKIYTNAADEYLVIGPKKSGVISSNTKVLDRDTLGKIEELLAYMDIYYYEDYDSEAVRTSLLKGTLEGLGDPYSVYYSPEEYTSIQTSTAGKYYGIGVGLTQNAETMEVSVVKVYEDTPAEEAGLLDGDQILMVGDVDASSVELSLLVEKIRGEEGTKVRLLVYRESTGESLEFHVERRNVELSSVSSELLEGKIGYIQISEFHANTAKQFEDQAAALQTQGMEGLIVDLRGNPGGLVTSVVQILDDILPEGLIVYTEDKLGNKNSYSSDENCMDYPLVVLVDGGSASASEIFAGAIKDYGYGTLIGTTTFGKGIVQTVFPLEGGDAIKITTAKYYTPKGSNIHGVGITPNEVIDYQYGGSKDEPYDRQYDNQFQRALEVMRGMLD